MAIAAGNSANSTQSSTANQASTTIAGDGVFSIDVGHLVVMIIAVDNSQTTDGDEGAVTSITDTAGSNVWSKAAEFCNGQTAAQAGATCSIWYCQAVSQITGATTITVNFSNAASRDKSCITYRSFTVGAGSTVAIEGTPATLANDGADPGSLNVTTGLIECLRVRGIAAESSTATALSPTDGTWTAFSGQTTAGGGSTANMAVRGEFKISTATGAASDPTLFAADCASVYVAFKEVVAAGFNTQKRNQLFIQQAKRRASFY